MDNKQLIILTTPHQKCMLLQIKHLCDLYAKKLADELYTTLQHESRIT